ncbi:MAG: hypothetical protein V1847_04345 [Candidatus Diapherotrites archaeon]
MIEIQIGNEDLRVKSSIKVKLDFEKLKIISEKTKNQRIGLGGEPLKPRQWKRILEIFAKTREKSLLSDIKYINDEKLNAAKKLGFKVYVSVKNFQKAPKNKIARIKKKVCGFMVLNSNKNMDAVNFFKREKARLYIENFVPSSKTELAKRKNLKVKRCSAGINIGITSNGDCFPCITMRDIPTSKLGNLMKEDLKSLKFKGRKFAQTLTKEECAAIKRKLMPTCEQPARKNFLP